MQGLIFPHFSRYVYQHYKEKTEALLNTGKEIGLEVNADKTKCMFISHHQTTGHNHNIKVGNYSFENVAEFKYLGMTVIHQNCIHEEMMSSLNARNVCCHVFQNPLSSCVLSKNVKIAIYRTIILSIVLCLCETLSR
jgi:hypothetical protein